MPKPKSEREFPMGSTDESFFEKKDAGETPPEGSYEYTDTVGNHYCHVPSSDEKRWVEIGKKEAEEKIADYLSMMGEYDSAETVRKGEY